MIDKRMVNLHEAVSIKDNGLPMILGTFKCIIDTDGEITEEYRQFMEDTDGARRFVNRQNPDITVERVTHYYVSKPVSITTIHNQCELCGSTEIGKTPTTYQCRNKECGVFGIPYPYGTDQTKYHTNGLVIHVASAKVAKKFLDSAHCTDWGTLTTVSSTLGLVTSQHLEYTFTYNETEIKLGLFEYKFGQHTMYLFLLNPMYHRGDSELLALLESEFDLRFTYVGEGYTNRMFSYLVSKDTTLEDRAMFDTVVKALQLDSTQLTELLNLAKIKGRI